MNCRQTRRCVSICSVVKCCTQVWLFNRVVTKFTSSDDTISSQRAVIEDSVATRIIISSSASCLTPPGVCVEMVSFVRHVSNDALSGSRQVPGMQKSLSAKLSANIQLLSQKETSNPDRQISHSDAVELLMPGAIPDCLAY